MGARHTDVLIIGAGIAGLSAALRLADGGRKVTVLSKGAVTDSSSFWAQGGIAAVLDPLDSLSSHVADTLEAGRWPFAPILRSDRGNRGTRHDSMARATGRAVYPSA